MIWARQQRESSSPQHEHVMCISTDENEISMLYIKMLTEVIWGGGIMEDFYFFLRAILNFWKYLLHLILYILYKTYSLYNMHWFLLPESTQTSYKGLSQV